MSTDELMQEARAANLIAWKQRVAWIKQKLKNDPSQVEALSKSVRRMGWTSISVSGIAEHLAKQKEKGKGLAERLNAIGNANCASIKRKYPIKAYCERYLRLRFVGNKCKCPLHDGHTDESFVIDEAKGRWYCFGDCPPDPGFNHRSGDVIDLHRIVTNLESNQAALNDLATWDESLGKALTCFVCVSYGPAGPEENEKPKREAKKPMRKSEKDEALIAEALKACEKSNMMLIRRASPVRFPTAEGFAEWLMQQPVEGHLIVAHTKYKALIGRRALAHPDRLQYLVCCTAKTETGGKHNPNLNLDCPMFLNVEFDDTPADQQLRLLWYLKERLEWKLISITFSGSKSYHGLFDVRGSDVEPMRTLALKLGACRRSLQPFQYVRFPGGTRTLEDWVYTPTARQEILYFDDTKNQQLGKVPTIQP